MVKIISNIKLAAIASLTVGLAPFMPEPHIIGKLRWIAGGAKGMKIIDYFDFLMHGLPWLLFFIFIGQFIYAKYIDKTVPVDLQSLINQDDARVIDVREEGEFSTGHFKGAENIPLSKFQLHVSKLKEEKRPLILYCRSGNRSGKAMKILKRAGKENVYNGGGLRSMKKYEE